MTEAGERVPALQRKSSVVQGVLHARRTLAPRKMGTSE